MTATQTTTRAARMPRNDASPAPHAVDIHVGQRINLRRKLLGISQLQVADAAGVSFQQVQKYERGDNRVSASKLHMISKALGVPVAFFFDGYDDPEPGAPPF